MGKNKNNMNKCESCNQKSVKVLDYSNDEIFPYHLCFDCQNRLHNYSLRPLEYFNLKAIHGDTGLLQDDLYDEYGTACQPQKDIESDESLAFPVFDNIKTNMERLLDWATVLWELEAKSIIALRQFDKKDMLTSLQSRIKKNANTTYRMYEICANVLEQYAESWVLSEWQNRAENSINFYGLILAKCTLNGFNLYTNELDKYTDFKNLNGNIQGLIWFQNPKSLVWIEQNASRIETCTDNWSYVVVVSHFDWATCERWFQKERILGLIALDTLKKCAYVHGNPQKLHNPESIDIMSEAVNQYVLKDNVPRTRNCNTFIQNNWAAIITDKEQKT